MSGEGFEAKKQRARKIYDRLKKAYPDATVRLHFSTPFELLVATILAAQCTDDKVNEVTAELFKEASTPEAFDAMPQEKLEQWVRPTGFFRNKAKSIKAASRKIIEEHGGKVPEEMDDLVALPGVARKTANVIRAGAFGKPGVICDTHMIRVSGRLGLTDHTDPVKIEFDIRELLHHNSWSRFSHTILFHGRAVCQAKKPACDRCVVSGLCPSAFDFPHFKKK